MLRLPRIRYAQPTSQHDALRLKEDAGFEGTYVAGGTDLYPNMKRRHQEPRVVVSLSRVAALREVGGRPSDGMTVGAGVSLADVESLPDVTRHYGAVARAAGLVSTPVLRNMGTLGGNLCLDTRCNYYNQSYEWRKAIGFCMKKDGETCWVAPRSPRCWAVQSSDIAPIMVAIDASFVVAGSDGERALPARQFYRDDGMTYLTKAPHEILTAVRLPATDDWDATYWKLRRRGSFDFPVLGVAVWIRWNGREAAEARVVLGGVASYPQDVPGAADVVRGTALDDDIIDAAAHAAFKPAKPMDNTDFGLAWRKQMTRHYVAGALRELRDRRRAR